NVVKAKMQEQFSARASMAQRRKSENAGAIFGASLNGTTTKNEALPHALYRYIHHRSGLSARLTPKIPHPP
ncbi:MAG TPA: hypothetical protein VLC97_04065, partial [Rhodanobacteraceae bacterium]|nr:hypothetical protein [Rhodanobacteraceae bacterium]